MVRAYGGVAKLRVASSRSCTVCNSGAVLVCVIEVRRAWAGDFEEREHSYRQIEAVEEGGFAAVVLVHTEDVRQENQAVDT